MTFIIPVLLTMALFGYLLNKPANIQPSTSSFNFEGILVGVWRGIIWIVSSLVIWLVYFIVRFVFG